MTTIVYIHQMERMYRTPTLVGYWTFPDAQIRADAKNRSQISG